MVNTPANQELALDASRQGTHHPCPGTGQDGGLHLTSPWLCALRLCMHVGMTLLENLNNRLPLSASQTKSVAVIGPNGVRGSSAVPSLWSQPPPRSFLTRQGERL